MTGCSLYPIPPAPPRLALQRRGCASTKAHASISPSPSASSVPDALLAIQNSGVIACLRAESAKLAMEAARAALRGGISVLEIVMSTPGVLEVVRDLVLEFPSSTIGVGTVLNVVDAKSAVKSGAKFLMSPATIREILIDIQSSEVLYIPGVMTPTEILSAYNAGARVVKIFPVSALGGTNYLSVLKKPFSHIPMVASQGIKIDQVEEYIKSGALAVVLSDAIFDKAALKQKKIDMIYQLAHAATFHGRDALDWKKRGGA